MPDKQLEIKFDICPPNADAMIQSMSFGGKINIYLNSPENFGEEFTKLKSWEPAKKVVTFKAGKLMIEKIK